LEAGNTATGGKQGSEDSVQPERLSEKGDYSVYWIHTNKHKDIYCEGYVGITIDTKSRMRSHKKNKKKSPIVDAIKSYSWENLEIEIIEEELTMERALEIEGNYRPRLNIGWNLQKGGELGVTSDWYNNPVNKEAHSKATSIGTKAGIQEKDSTEERSKRAKNSWLKNADSYKGSCRGSKNGKARLNEEQVFEIRFKLIPEGLSNKEIAKDFNVKPYVIQFIRTGKTWKHVVCDSPAHK